MHLDTSRTFNFSIKDETTGETRTARAAATARTDGGEDILFIATGQAYRRSSAQALQFVRAPEFDLVDPARELNDAPKPKSYDAGEYFNAQVYESVNASTSDIVRVRNIGDGVVEDEEGNQYFRHPVSMKLIYF